MTTTVSMKRRLRSGNIVEGILGFDWLWRNWRHLNKWQLGVYLMHKAPWVAADVAADVADMILMAGDCCALQWWRKVIETFVKSIALIIKERGCLFSAITSKTSYNADLCYCHLEALRMGHDTGLWHYRSRTPIFSRRSHWGIHRQWQPPQVAISYYPCIM